jgi:RNA polymerase sigma factor (sigma-70 family)
MHLVEAIANMLFAPEIDDLAAAPPESDGRLLERFIRDEDGYAFEEIVRRHGLMVFGVCQRVLDNRHDAEDCFQAVFMVLVRKAATIVPREMVGNWLYGVAYRTALEARKLAAQRRNLEKKKFAMPQPESAAEIWTEMRPLLDQELNRLPDKYRFVLVACDLEGKTRKTVADQLGVPEGTVASRLARARAMLAKRLQRHALIVSPLFLANLLSEHGCAIYLPETLIANVVGHAASVPSDRTPATRNPTKATRLADAVIKAMLWTKIKIAAAVVGAAIMLGVGVAALLPSANAELKQDIAKAGPKKPHVIRDCILRKVDAAKNTVEFDEQVGAAPIGLVRIEADTKIVIAGKVARLNELKPDMAVNVEVQRGADGQVRALQIEAVGSSISGSVKAVKEGTLTLQEDGVAIAIVEETTYEVDPSVKVVVKGKEGKLADIERGMQVTLQMSAPRERQRIVAIVAKP